MRWEQKGRTVYGQTIRSDELVEAEVFGRRSKVDGRKTPYKELTSCAERSNFSLPEERDSYLVEM